VFRAKLRGDVLAGKKDSAVVAKEKPGTGGDCFSQKRGRAGNLLAEKRPGEGRWLRACLVEGFSGP